MFSVGFFYRSDVFFVQYCISFLLTLFKAVSEWCGAAVFVAMQCGRHGDARCPQAAHPHIPGDASGARAERVRLAIRPVHLFSGNIIR